MPERVPRQVYCSERVIGFISGSETGKQSEPSVIGTSLHAAGHGSEPEVVLCLMDWESSLDPHALLAFPELLRLLSTTIDAPHPAVDDARAGHDALQARRSTRHDTTSTRRDMNPLNLTRRNVT